MGPGMFLAAGVDGAAEFGAMLGGSIILLLLLAAVLKCMRILRRPTASKPCVAALLLLFIAWMVNAVASMAARHHAVPESIPGLVALALAMPLVLASLVTGIVGLCTYDPSRFVQGRAQAIWAIVLSGLAVTGFIIAVVFQTIGQIRKESPFEPGPSVAAGQPIVKDEFNFSLIHPAGWVGLKAKALNEEGCLALRCKKPDVCCTVIAETVGIGVKREALKEVVRSGLARSVRILQQTEAETSLSGATFDILRTRARVGAIKADIFYEHWIGSGGGFVWQVVFWTQEAGGAGLAREARKVMEGFRVLDSARIAGTSVEDVERPALGYATRLAGMGWNTWSSGEHDALVDFSAQRIAEALLVVPVRFEEEAPDLEALSRALLRTLELEYPAEDEYRSAPWRPPHGGEGVEITTDQDVDDVRFSYVLRVARLGDSAHLLAGWALSDSGDIQLVRRSLDAITLRAPEGSPPPPEEARLAARGLLLNRIGLSYYARNDYPSAVRWFRRGFEQTKADATLLENLGLALEEAGRHEEGRDYLAPHVSAFPESFDIPVRHARLQALAGDPRAANEAFLGLIERGLRSEDDIRSWLDLLEGLDEYAEARRAADAWAAKQPGLKARRWQAGALFEAGDRKEALSILAKLCAENPNDIELACDFGEYSNRAGEHASAAEAAQKLLESRKDLPRALMILGWSQMGRKWYREAKATFERAAVQAPGDEDIQDAIRDASALLGQGNNSDVKQPLEPVALPREVLRSLDRDPASDFGKGYPAVWLLRATGYGFEKGKPLRRTYHLRVKVLTSEGANDFSSLEFTFDPLSERIFMNRLEVRDSSGGVVAAGTLDDAYVRDLDNGMATHRKVLHLQAPGLRPGHILEAEVTSERLAAAESFAFQRHLMVRDEPAAAEAVFITGDVSAVRSELAQGESVEILRTGELAAWIARGLEPPPDETMAIWPERRHPMLWLGAPGGDWAVVAREYMKEIEDLLRSDEAAAELAKSVAELPTEREKFAALARRVQREIGYQAIEFGVRARRPAAARETLRRRYGDCKDHALLLHQVLRAAGIESHLALVNTGWRIQPELPSIDQFNHMVVHVPLLAPGWLVDPTEKHLKLDAFPADDLWHARALLLDPANPRLLPAPPPPLPGSARVQSRRTVRPSGRDWNVEETLEIDGYYAAWMRSGFAGLSPSEQTQKAQELMAAHGAARLEAFEFRGLDDPMEPARLRIVYSVRDAISPPGGSVAAPLPACWERFYLTMRFVKERRTAFEMRYPFRFSSQVIVELPAPASEASVSGLAEGAEGEFCAWKVRAAPAEPGSPHLRVDFEFEARPCERPAARFSAFHDAWDAARRAWDRTLSWDPR